MTERKEGEQDIERRKRKKKEGRERKERFQKEEKRGRGKREDQEGDELRGGSWGVVDPGPAGGVRVVASLVVSECF